MTPSEPIAIDIRPEVNILSVLRHLNYKPWFALAEFVDNSLASFLQERASGRQTAEFLTVSIEIDNSAGGRILITDDAYGIDAADFPRAFRAADVPPDVTGLSEFGMGMKSAASWFASKWSVRTSVAGEPVQRSIKFDLDDIVQHQTHTLLTQDLPADPRSHFTTVELRQLNHLPQGRTLGKIRSHLASIYRMFLRRGDLHLFLNGEPVTFAEVQVLTAPPAWDLQVGDLVWRKRIQFDLAQGRSVEGFVGIRAKGSTSEAGLALFRRDRLILGSYDESYRPSEIFKKSTNFEYQRVFGELQLVGFEISYTKDGFRWEEDEEAFLSALSREISAEPMDILRQAAEYRTKVPQVDERPPIVQAVGQVATSVERTFPAAVDKAAESPMPDDFIPNFLLGDEADIEPVEKQVRFAADDGLWLVDMKATLNEASPDWLQVGSQYDSEDPEDGRVVHRLDVTINFGHPFSREYIGPDGENSALFLALGSSIGMALALGKKSGARSQFVLSYLNLVLNSSFQIS